MGSGWNEEPANFLAELYGEDEVDMESDDEVLPASPSPPSPRFSESPSPPPYSPLTSPERRVRDRSQSPINNQQQYGSMPYSDIVIGVFVEDLNGLDIPGVPFENPDVPHEDPDVLLDDEGDVFMTPDAHALYECSERMESVTGDSVTDDRNESGVVDDRGVVEDQHNRDVRARSVRGRVRGGRRGNVSGRGRRGRGVGGGHRRRGAARTWEVGHPLEEIWMTDDDVPLELREMAMDVVRRRQTSTHANANVNRSTRERRNRLDEDNDSVSENEDEFEDANGRGNSLLEEVLPHFEWSPMETFQGKEETFRPERTGSVESYSSPYDAFRSYWDESIIQVIVEETNQYATIL